MPAPQDDEDVAAHSTIAEIEEAFAAAGVQGAVHVVDVSSGQQVGVRADEPRCAASVFKLPVLVALVRASDAGLIDLGEQVTVPADGRTGGPTGLSAASDPVTASWRDLARWMMVISDNAATDVILDRLGLPAVAEALAELGCSSTSVPYDIRTLFSTIYEDAGVSGFAEFPTSPSVDQLATWRALDPEQTIRTTARDMTHLLAAVLGDRAASPQSCALVRQVLQQQVWPHRLTSGFPEDVFVLGGKTGTLPPVRNEVGFVQHADGSQYACAVFTSALSPASRNPAADAVIGQVARLAVDELRGSRALG